MENAWFTQFKSALGRQLADLAEFVETIGARVLVYVSYGLAISLVPAFAVSAVLKSSSYVVRKNPKTYRDHPLDDGTARYDDVWGG